MELQNILELSLEGKLKSVKTRKEENKESVRQVYRIKKNELDEILNYYYKQKKKDLLEDENISVDEDGTIIRRVSEYEIGEGVLGRAFVYHNYIEIREDLHGNDYEIVLGHEKYHLNNPQHSEIKTRLNTGTYNWDTNKYLSTC